MKQYRHLIQTAVLGGLLLAVSLCCWLKEDGLYSASERRVLAQQPEPGWEEVLSGDYMEDFEAYTLDQFPARDAFRSLKAVSALGLFGHKDNNALYLADGHLSKLEYPLKQAMLDHAAKHFAHIYDTYLKDSGGEVYFSIIPDKNCYLAAENGYLSLNYDEFISHMRARTDGYMEYIDITGLLSADDYYRTDTHWKQERILDVAQTIADAMGVTLEGEYEVKTLDQPFYGVWYGQAALPLEPDTISYLTNDELENCSVKSYDLGTGTAGTVYDNDKVQGKDPYDFFLSGAVAVMTIENPAADPERELVVFRDSFGSSLVPLLAEGYGTITLIDTRYISSDTVGKMVDFNGKDVLFLYSTLLLNNSLSLR